MSENLSSSTTTSISVLASINQKKAQFIYGQTPLGKGQIRLIHLHPCDHVDEPVFCTAHVANLKDAEYAALSYVWGSEESPGEIFFGAGLEHPDSYIEDEKNKIRPRTVTPFKVTSNLHLALRHLREKGKVVFFWIDALSINQSDVQERNFQVAQMADIYKNAFRVDVWLCSTIKYEGMLGNFRDALMRQSLQHIDRANESKSIKALSDQLLALSEPEFTKFTLSFFHLCNLSEYWRRAWTLQEVRCSQGRVVLRYPGCPPVPIAGLRGILEAEDDSPALSNRFTKAFLDLEMPHLAHFVETPPYLYVSPRGCDAVDLIEQYVHSKCKDPRDYIFAMRECLIPAIRDAIPVDYSMSVVEVFRIGSKALLQAGTLNILSLCPTRPTINGLPSWCPRFGNPEMAPKMKNDCLIADWKRPNAIKKVVRTPYVKFDDDGHVMRVKGAAIGTVRHIIKGWPRDTFWSQAESDQNGRHEFLKTPLRHRNVTLEAKEVMLRAYSNLSVSGLHNAEEFVYEEVQVEGPVSTGQSDDTLESIPIHLHRMATEMHHRHTLYQLEPIDNTRDIICLGTDALKVGDQICIIFGCHCPMVLRMVNDHYIIIGTSWLDLETRGKFIDKLADENFVATDFFIR